MYWETLKKYGNYSRREPKLWVEPA